MKNGQVDNRIFADRSAFRRTVRLARVQVEGLSDDELSGALAYEVEPYSSIPAAEAAVAWQRRESGDPAVEEFEVAVIRRRRTDGFEERFARWLKPLTVLAVAVLAAVGVDYWAAAREKSNLEKSLARRSPLQAELDRLDRRIASLRKDAGEIRRTRENAACAQRECARLRAAFPGFFEAAASLKGGAVLKKIEGEEGDFAVRLVFAAVDGQAAATAMADLTAALSQKGWEFIPEGIFPAGGGSTVEFKGKAAFR